MHISLSEIATSINNGGNHGDVVHQVNFPTITNPASQQYPHIPFSSCPLLLTKSQKQTWPHSWYPQNQFVPLANILNNAPGPVNKPPQIVST
jgi:hypothetical protein